MIETPPTTLPEIDDELVASEIEPGDNTPDNVVYAAEALGAEETNITHLEADIATKTAALTVAEQEAANLQGRIDEEARTAEQPKDQFCQARKMTSWTGGVVAAAQRVFYSLVGRTSNETNAVGVNQPKLAPKMQFSQAKVCTGPEVKPVAKASAALRAVLDRAHNRIVGLKVEIAAENAKLAEEKGHITSLSTDAALNCTFTQIE